MEKSPYILPDGNVQMRSADWWIQAEDDIGATFHKSRTYRALRDMVENQGDIIFDTEGFLCQADDGECTAF